MKNGGPAKHSQLQLDKVMYLVTPIQIARMISSIFTGQLVTPRILMEEPIQKKPLEISLETRKLLQQSMQKAGQSRNRSDG